MPQFEPIVLVAYVDGELDEETRRAVERAMVEDSKIAETVRELRDSAAWLRSGPRATRHTSRCPPVCWIPYTGVSLGPAIRKGCDVYIGACSRSWAA